MRDKTGGPKIIIIGAGPSGLATGYFLKKRGYRNVLILEKLGRVGGLCDSITCEGHSFDLGANYVTPAYKEVLKIAAEVGAKFYTERPLIAMEVPPDGSDVKYSTIFNATRIDDKTGETLGVLDFFSKLAKYTWLRWRLRGIIDKPTMAGVENHPDLCQPFSGWLCQHGLHGLTRLFELPVTMMGYGAMDETPALYALKFMSVQTFVPMAMKEAPFIGNYVGWPKRFTHGFQRFWERVSWDLEVRLNVEVEEVSRPGVDAPEGGRIRVKYNVLAQELNATDREDGELCCDHVIFACPQSVLLGRNSIACGSAEHDDPAKQFMELTDREKNLFEQICEVWYCMTTYHVRGLQKLKKWKSPLAAVYPLAPALHPRGIAKQWDDCDFVQFYSPVSAYDIERDRCAAKKRMEKGEPGAKELFEELDVVWTRLQNPIDGEDPVKDMVLRNIEQTVKQMGATIVPETDAWHTYNRFTYFQHVPEKSLKAGFYTQLEELQGEHDTYFVGGATNFELVEPIVEYAKNLVHDHFPPIR